MGRQMGRGTGYPAQEKQRHQRDRAEAARHDRREGQHPDAVDGEMGEAGVEKHIADERHRLVPEGLRRSPMRREKGMRIARGDEGVIGKDGLRDQLWRPDPGQMGGNQNGDHPKHDRGNAEKGLPPFQTSHRD